MESYRFPTERFNKLNLIILPKAMHNFIFTYLHVVGFLFLVVFSLFTMSTFDDKISDKLMEMTEIKIEKDSDDIDNFTLNM